MQIANLLSSLISFLLEVLLSLVALHKCKGINLLAADGQGAVVTTHNRDTSEQARRGQEPQSGYQVGETEDSPFSFLAGKYTF